MRAARRGDLATLRGRAVTRGALRVRWQETGTELAVAYTIPAKGTTAVARNRLRRQLRAAVRTQMAEATGILHISTNARTPQEYTEISRDLGAAWAQIQKQTGQKNP